MTDSMVRIVVVEDDESIRTMLAVSLRHAGHHVETAATGSEGLRLVRETRPDLVVLDVGLPDIDGFTVCQRLREDADEVPVIFLTARRDGRDVRAGFEGGADDYVTKPFSLDELRFRIDAVLRRSGTRSGQRRMPRLRCGHVELDEEAHRVWSRGAEVELTPTEFRLLRYLLANADRTLTRAQILDHVWPQDFDGGWEIIESYVSSLRRRLDDVGPERVIRTVRGVGYAAQSPDTP